MPIPSTRSPRGILARGRPRADHPHYQNYHLQSRILTVELLHIHDFRKTHLRDCNKSCSVKHHHETEQRERAHTTKAIRVKFLPKEFLRGANLGESRRGGKHAAAFPSFLVLSELTRQGERRRPSEAGESRNNSRPSLLSKKQKVAPRFQVER